MPFALGQRWISDSESDLGLGTVIAVEARTVTLLFPASEENRVYARNDAPLTRVMFNPGDQIQSHEGWELLVAQVEEQGGLLTYHGTRIDTSETDVALREILLCHTIQLSKPQDKLFAGQIDRMDRFALRYRALQHQQQQQTGELRGLTGMRASLIPHQLYIAHEVGRRYAPRVLLADEVGLGKTIEAGMIIHQQVLSHRAERVLIVVPETLQHQWLVEMMRRFNLHFSIFDEERCLEADARNPFETAQFVLLSIDFLRKHRQRCEELCAADWDLLVVDEAHHLTWSEEKASREYQIIESLAEHTPGVLLLTATPEQLGHQSHFARLRLLDPDRFYDYPAFVEEEKAYAPVAEAVNALNQSAELPADAEQTLRDKLNDAVSLEALAVLTDANSDSAAQLNARQTLVQQLMDRHGTGRILFRNTRGGVKGFQQRQLTLIPLAMPTQYETALKVASIMNKRLDDAGKTKQYLYPEEIYQQFEGDGDSATWWRFDPRIDWLLEHLKANRQEKILVICGKASTALSIEQALREREGIRGTVFHEGMTIIERDKAAAYFAQEEAGAQVLICSEIGSEGRNFQFAHQLVMFDLPMNPDLLEQRIGRLDRIGQRQTIEIFVPLLAGGAQEKLATWYHQGLNAFEETCPTGRAVYDQFGDAVVASLANNQPTDSDFEALVNDSRELHNALKAKLEAGRDRLLEQHSNGGAAAEALAERIANHDGDTELVAFALGLFDTAGLHQDDKGDNAIVLHPSEHMLLASYPGLPQDGCTITFERDVALSREDVQFVSWEHPLVQGGIEMLLAEGAGTTAVSVLKNKALPAGTLFLELIYTVQAQAPKRTGIHQFLPATPIRVLLDNKGNDLAAQVEFDSFHRQLSPINRHLASKVVNSVQTAVHQLIQHGDIAAEKQGLAIREQAKTTMQQMLGNERDRLVNLKAVNPNIRDVEIEQIAEQIETLSQSIDSAQIGLDSLRLIVVSHN
ncbi:RNA polymerase-associated protein RapA [Vibrio stylophorae]|uniref:RNA polymerase-associated protein RapA n=1 Tax=Vibrio stylophorae TaxID=659351 RepID=A0ABM8ZVP4_9VIBR|nr:RNA polymerase-associated protein RapA [Vibrio stylophorae]CAH0534397.1 RNA polymerase-associated protein RapA [Vibrio stylophorae]